MKEFIEKLIGRLEEQAIEHRETGFEMERKGFSNIADKQYAKQTTYLNAIEIVNQLAEEYGKDINVPANGWIPCSERLPKDDSFCIVTVEYPNNKVKVTYGWFDRVGVCWYVGMHEMRTTNIHAWQPLPAPYEPKGEK